MTKEQLIASLADLPNTAQVLIRCVASSSNIDAMIDQAKADIEVDGFCAELSEITEIGVYKEDGPSAPAFVIIEHRVEYLNN